jgi:hypothetical protein
MVRPRLPLSLAPWQELSRPATKPRAPHIAAARGCGRAFRKQWTECHARSRAEAGPAKPPKSTSESQAATASTPSAHRRSSAWLSLREERGSQPRQCCNDAASPTRAQIPERMIAVAFGPQALSGEPEFVGAKFAPWQLGGRC